MLIFHLAAGATRRAAYTFGVDGSVRLERPRTAPPIQQSPLASSPPKPSDGAGPDYYAMQLGIVFPQHEIGTDPAIVQDFADMVEALGFDHIVAYEHVAGADPTRHNLNGPYTHQSTFHEPFVLFGYMAAITKTIGLWFGVLVLPQRQTVLVAKQAATLDVLSRGRVTLGVGVGWNEAEYEMLGSDFGNRGRRLDMQIPLLRRLWTESLIDHQDAYHRIDGGAICPRPHHLIPIWIGGWADAVLRRVGRVGDGWLAWPSTNAANAYVTGPADLDRPRRVIAEAAHGAGRDPADIGLAVAISTIGTDETWDPGRLAERAHEWSEAGATHAALGTMWAGFSTPAEHFAAVQAFCDAYGHLEPATPSRGDSRDTR